MKYLIAVTLVFSFVLPVYANAQTTTKVPVQKDTLVQLIASLLKQIESLQKQLEQKQKEEAEPLKVETDNSGEYQRKVASLLDLLDEKEEIIEMLEEKIEQKECNRSKWFYADGKRTFKCYDQSGAVPKVSNEINELKEDLASLLSEKEEVEDKIENLKTRYGI